MGIALKTYRIYLVKRRTFNSRRTEGGPTIDCENKGLNIVHGYQTVVEFE